MKIKQIQIYACEHCGQTFTDSGDCKLHELNCEPPFATIVAYDANGNIIPAHINNIEDICYFRSDNEIEGRQFCNQINSYCAYDDIAFIGSYYNKGCFEIERGVDDDGNPTLMINHIEKTMVQALQQKVNVLEKIMGR